MNYNREDFEIMAPAGSFDSLRAAIQGGADSVYFGIEQLNMRARSANNFTRQDLPEIMSIARENKLKTYLTVNTVIYNHELGMVREIIDLARYHGVNAVIAADQSVLSYARKAGVEVHLSTQLNISNIESLKFYAAFGDVAVLARELDLNQVAEIGRGIELEDITGPSGKPVRLEMFVHGALCMAVSGKCYLSLHEHNHSANRGDCFQVCRRSYIVT
ncbi:MAG TPA: peptidase U32 family protein, partial [Bacteroidales bacterium]|nr:peptidase U32 family protein [Bacteroidales bacterium]